MHIDLIQTFLAVIESGNFGKAAERVHVTQSTVSMRIKALEDSLGRQLFMRSKAGADLTPAGVQFRHYAETMLRLWQQARQAVALPPRFEGALNVGGQFSLWDRLLLRWLPWMRAAAPQIRLQAEVGSSDVLMSHLSEGLIDIGVMYNPQTRPGLVTEKLLEEKLILVTTDRRAVERPVPGVRYVFVDWGRDFLRTHSEAFPDLEAPAISVGLGSLGLHYILENGGSGYFPKRIVRALLADGRLFEVTAAPSFARPAYMVYPAAEQYEIWFERALAGLRHVAALETEE